MQLAGESSLSFLGAQVYGSLARIETDTAQRQRYLALGELSLAQGAVSHNFFVFCECAIHAALRAGEWAEAERFCDKLVAYTAKEPFPWADFIIARGRALSRVGRGETGEALLVTLESLHRQGKSAQANLYLPELVAALEQLRQTA